MEIDGGVFNHKKNPLNHQNHYKKQNLNAPSIFKRNSFSLFEMMRLLIIRLFDYSTLGLFDYSIIQLFKEIIQNKFIKISLCV
ncbi:hypothetical protein BpHYR1_051409 [Brachionus plicatilis]|uniref:Uncharacterized protein n=1 Tax=Brachionus plicatilis TaxID=10195 RepID=A0A3M7S2M9_BRAPC|nr:hypothetical protein BpHYR1_051409 [Brachionus plicatilis]